MTLTSAYRVLGNTDDVTTCEYCGRSGLNGTVVLAVLDAEGNDTGERAYFGTGCAATAGRATVREVRADVRAVQQAERAARFAEAERNHQTFIAARDAWITAHYGPDALNNPRKYGFNSPVRIVRAFCEATGR